MSHFLSLTGADTLAIISTDEAREKRDKLVLASQRIETVVTPDDATRTADAIRDLKSFAAMVEAERKGVKAPVLAVGKQIDTVADELALAVNGERQRLERILGAWTAEQARLEREAQQRAWEEEQRIKREAEEQMRHAEAHSRNQASFEKKADRIEAKAFEQIAETRAAVAEVKAIRPAGTALHKVPCFEVTDIYALYEAAPTLVKLEPIASAIKSAIKNLPTGKSLPGVRHWFEDKATVRG